MTKKIIFKNYYLEKINNNSILISEECPKTCEFKNISIEKKDIDNINIEYSYEIINHLIIKLNNNNIYNVFCNNLNEIKKIKGVKYL